MIRRVSKFVVPLLVTAGLVFMAVRVVKLRKAELAKVPGPISVPLPVHVARIQKGFLEVTRSYLGVVRPMVSSSLAPQVTGQILEVRVREGDRVRKGQILVRLETGLT